MPPTTWFPGLHVYLCDLVGKEWDTPSLEQCTWELIAATNVWCVRRLKTKLFTLLQDILRDITTTTNVEALGSSVKLRDENLLDGYTGSPLIKISSPLLGSIPSRKAKWVTGKTWGLRFILVVRIQESCLPLDSMFRYPQLLSSNFLIAKPPLAPSLWA